MKKRWKFLCLIILSLLSFPGCGQKAVYQPPVVTGISITCRREDRLITRNYTRPEKVHRLLCYLRRQPTKGYARVDPERVMGDAFWIRVQLSDGRSRIYRQRCGRFLSVDCSRWKNIDEAYGRRLYYLLYAIPEDPNPVANGSTY